MTVYMWDAGVVVGYVVYKKWKKGRKMKKAAGGKNELKEEVY